MLHIKVRTMDADGQVIDTAALEGRFADIADARSHLDQMVKRLRQPNGTNDDAGYAPQQGYWWTRQSGITKRYTVEV